ncbi:MAG: metal ABC transporter substrate-binding protein, partial [Oscillospiraceae bacterium]|nr:metal ABC transporter substrate-binding protein [Oscillospiraceae bacterium]
VYIEQLGEGYYNVIAVRNSDADKAFAKDIAAAVHSEEFRDLIEDPSKQYTAFNKPSGYND